MIREFLRSIKLKDMMSAPVISIQEFEDFHVVKDKMETYDIRHLPVVDANGRLCGLISQRHLYRIHSPRRLENGGWYYDKEMLDGFILKRVMVHEPYALKADSTLEEAMHAMVHFKFGCIPVVDALHKPVGIITRDTVIEFLLNK